MKAHVSTITNLLLGAAYADKRLEGDEVKKIHELLLRLLGTDALPSELTEQIGNFNPASFRPVEAASSLSALAHDERRKVLEMVASVNESDDEIDFHEDRYLGQVAEGLGFSSAEIADLKLDVTELDELDGILAGLGE